MDKTRTINKSVLIGHIAALAEAVLVPLWLTPEHDQVTEAAIETIVEAGYDVDSVDEIGTPVNDAVQTLLMVAYALAPKLAERKSEA